MEQLNIYLCIAPNTWGKGTSVKEAKRSAYVFDESKPYTVYLFFHDQFSVDDISGTLTYKGEAPKTIIRTGW